MKPLDKAQAEALIHTIAENRSLSALNQSRLALVLTSMGDDGRATLGQVLDLIFRDDITKEQLAKFRKWRNEIKSAAEKAGSSFELKVDQHKKNDVSERQCWIESGQKIDLTHYNEQATHLEFKPVAMRGMRAQTRYCYLYHPHDEAGSKKLIAELEPLLKQAGFQQHGGPIVVQQDSLQKGDEAIVVGSDIVIAMCSNHLSHALLDEIDPEKLVPVGMSTELNKGERTRFTHNNKCFDSCTTRPQIISFANTLFEAILKKKRSDNSNRKHHRDVIDSSVAIATRGRLLKASLNLLPDEGNYDHEYSREEGVDLVASLMAWAITPGTSNFCALLGEYGMGKTTTCKMLVQKTLEQRHVLRDLPQLIYLDLRELRNHAKSISRAEMDYLQIIDAILTHTWDAMDGEKPTAQQVTTWVREQRAVIIYDGLDEVINSLDNAAGKHFTRALWRILPNTARGKTSDNCGKVLITCRSHYFPDLQAARNHMLGEGREGFRQENYDAWLVLPFNDEQIENYLRQALPERPVEDWMELIAQIHNLSDLAKRPMLLQLIAEQIEEIENRRASGKSFQAVDLYDGLVRRWLERDDGKHKLHPNHKPMLMRFLAVRIWANQSRTMTIEELDDALYDFFEAHPKLEREYRYTAFERTQEEREPFKNDLRDATFLVWSADKVSHFRFSHTSILEYFLADALNEALANEDVSVWSIPAPSNECFEFLYQRLQGSYAGFLGQLLSEYHQNATENALNYTLQMHHQGRAAPTLADLTLTGVSLGEISFVGSETKPLDLSRSRFENCILYQCKFIRCDLSGASVKNSTFRQCQIYFNSIDGSAWQRNRVEAGCFRVDSLGGFDLSQLHNVDRDENSDHESIRLQFGKWVMPQDVALSADGKTVLSASTDGTLRLWDRETAQELRRFEGHKGSVTSCAYSADGKTVLSASTDGTLRLWDRETAQELRRFEGHKSPVTSCAYSADGKTVLSASTDRTFRLWESETAQELRRFEGHTDWVTSCAYSADGKTVLSASRDGTLRLWDRETAQELRRFEGHEDSVTSCAYSADGKTVLSASRDGTLRLWDRETAQELRRFEGHTDWVTSCAYSADGKTVLSASRDGTLRLWDRETAQELRRFEGHEDSVTSCAYSADGKTVLSASYDGTLRLWESETAQELRRFEGHEDSVTSCAYSADGKTVLSASYDGTLRLWDRETAQELRRFERHKGAVRSCTYSADGKTVLSASDDGTIRLWDRETAQELRRFEGHKGWVTSCSYSADGKTVLSASIDRTFRLWDSETAQELRRFEGHKDWVTSCAYSADGKTVLSASTDRTLRLWDSETAQELRRFEGHKVVVRSCAYSVDGKTVLSASTDGTLRLWDSETAQELRRFEGHNDAVTSCAYSADGKTVLSAADDGTLRLWDSETAQELKCIKLSSLITSCAIASDGSRACVATDDGLFLCDLESMKTLYRLDSFPDASASFDADNRLLNCQGPIWKYYKSIAQDGGNYQVLPFEASRTEEERAMIRANEREIV